MKFGSRLKDAIYPEWRVYYIDYDGLKKRLRKAEKDRPFTENDETEFVEDLDNNLEKVYAFHQQKQEELTSRIDSWADVIRSNPPESSMTRVSESINAIAKDVNHLARFSRLNYTGFLKIVKKHDRHTNYILRPMFMVRLNQCPFWRQDDEVLLVKLSELFAQVRRGRDAPVMDGSAGNTQLVVKRFFVHTDNIMELKTAVLRHLPVLVYNNQKNGGGRGGRGGDNIDPPISSLYLDNSNLELYNDRVESAEGSQVLRVRWYGSAKEKSTVYTFERRTWHEETGEKKEAFAIKDKYIDGFLRGERIFVNKSVTKMRNHVGKTEEDVVKFERLVTQVQAMIIEKGLCPVLRSYYRRTAFQIPGDNRIRMALDTDLCFIREDTCLFPDDATERRPSGHWHRPDVDIEYPFNQLSSSEINRYPYATFEIKLELPPNTPEPGWVTELQESGILEEAEHFNKFVHGVAMIFDTRVALLPYWLAQMDDEDLKKRIAEEEEEEEEEEQRAHKGKVRAQSQRASTSADTRVQVEQPSERTSLLGGNSAGASGSNYQATAPLVRDRIQSQDYRQEDWTNKVARAWSRLFHRGQHAVHKHPPVILPPGVKVPKKVITPLRVEPKVFFANERTYFSWMSLGALMSTFSIALFNAGDAVGKLSGVVYTLVSLTTLIYGMGLYYRRRELIQAKASGPYDDMVGPTLICFALLFAVGLNAYLKFTVKAPTLFYL
ncbi:VTC domain-containing protein [Dichotomocladium elegans]|nr:VTC domain-containing protein [Dichotomocladium elegans]